MPRFAWTNYFVLLTLVACLLLVVLDRTGIFPFLRVVTTTLYSWVLLIGGFALLLGVANVGLVHVRRIQGGQTGWLHSLALVATLFAVFVAGLLDPNGVRSQIIEWIFDSLIAPGQAMFFALTVFFMAAAAFYWLRIGRGGGGWMLAGALLMLLAQMPAANLLLPPVWVNLASWLLTIPVMATLRGALLGSGLALIIAGIRFLWGSRAA